MAAGDAFLLTSQFAAAGLFLLLAAVVLSIRFNSRVNRAFAIFLFLRGAYLLFLALARSEIDGPLYNPLIDTARYFLLATPFALVYFAAIYLQPHGGVVVRAVGAFVILGVLVVDLTYLLDHCTVQCSEFPRVAGPLTVVVQAVPLAEAVVGLVLVSAAHKLRGQAREQATLIVGTAFTLLALLESSPTLVSLATNGWSGLHLPFERNLWIRLSRLGILAAFLAAATSTGLLIRAQHSAKRKVLLLGVATVMVGTAVFLTANEDSEQASTQVITTTTFLFGAWRFLAASLVAYGLVRHRFLDLDLRINWTISRGAVAGVFLIVFLVVSQLIERAASEKLGYMSGALAAGILLFSIKPLERLGDRIADEVHPRGRRERMSLEAEQRVAIFREQATMVWSDGHIGRKERLLLDSLRDQLGIDAATAAEIEHTAAAESPFSSKSQALSTQS